MSCTGRVLLLSDGNYFRILELLPGYGPIYWNPDRWSVYAIVREKL